MQGRCTCAPQEFPYPERVKWPEIDLDAHQDAE